MLGFKQNFSDPRRPAIKGYAENVLIGRLGNHTLHLQITGIS